MYTFQLIHLTTLGKKVYDSNQQLILDLLNNELTPFIMKQLDLLLNSMDCEEEYIKESFKSRKDYLYYDHYHYIHNIITNEDSYCFVNKYTLIFKSDSKKNIFFDVLYQNQKNYVILGK